MPKMLLNEHGRHGTNRILSLANKDPRLFGDIKTSFRIMFEDQTRRSIHFIGKVPSTESMLTVAV